MKSGTIKIAIPTDYPPYGFVGIDLGGSASMTADPMYPVAPVRKIRMTELPILIGVGLRGSWLG